MAEDVVVDVSQDSVRSVLCSSGLSRAPAGSCALGCGARCRQVQALGGDCDDFMTLTDDRLALVLGDASGKGLAAALMMASVQSSLRTAALFYDRRLAHITQDRECADVQFVGGGPLRHAVL